GAFVKASAETFALRKEPELQAMLAQANLVRDAGTVGKLQAFAACAAALVLAVGAIRFVRGASLGRPVGFLLVAEIVAGFAS
ncbi:hypothetical protein, partial [Klebsiella pneumoniae]|uniref:hypothetical protein n=1 Tax=Klebsiella pneumoniae TaxID=573 RepID=UPI00385438F9